MPSTFSRYHAPMRTASSSTDRVEQARDHHDRALRLVLQEVVGGVQAVGSPA